MLCRFAPSVAMVQASEPWHRYHTRPGRRPLLDWPQVGSVLVQLIVNAILVMVPDVVVDDPSEMLFIQRDDVIEDFAATLQKLKERLDRGEGRGADRNAARSARGADEPVFGSA